MAEIDTAISQNSLLAMKERFGSYTVEFGRIGAWSGVSVQRLACGRRRSRANMGDENWQLLAQGAEARVYLARGLIPGEEESIVKERFEKAYRHKELDVRLTKQRFNGEVRTMIKAAKAGVDVPRIDFVDKAKKRIVMEFVKGKTLKRVFDDPEVTGETKLAYAAELGKTVGILHDAGLAHGDLTTSNVMIRDGRPDKLTMIDFGLAFSTKSAEDLGVDLYVLQRAFLSTHPNSEYLFDQVLAMYVQGGPEREKTRQHFNEVQQRGRKREVFG